MLTHSLRNAWQGVTVTHVKTPKYGQMLFSSKLCGVLPGWGWSGRMEDAVLHGCVPVILQDGIHAPWETVLGLQSYALRVPRHRMGSLLEILEAVPPQKLAAMQVALRRAWPRFSYLGLVVRDHSRRRSGGAHSPTAAGPPVAKLAPLVSRDATATLLQALHVRMLRREARAAGGGGGGHDDSTLRAAAGCELTAGGGEASVDPIDNEPEPDFEGRNINGWVV